MIIGKYKG
jgi:leucyl-tRNA synthetase